jgi:DNA-binding HxlR family transcriptional regulator
MENHKSLCPINLALEVFGDKWSLIIIRDMMFGNKRYFKDLLLSEEKIATNILSDRLNKFEEEGIVTKLVDPDHKLKYIYSLTQKGIDLLPVMTEIGNWGIKHLPFDEVKFQHAKKLLKGGKEQQTEMKKKIRKAHSKAPLN